MVQMLPIGGGHSGTAAALTHVFMQAAGARAAGDTLEAALLPGLRVAVADILGQSVIAGGGATEGVNHATRQPRA